VIEVAALLPYIPHMLAKLTAKNQLTLPKRLIDAVGRPTYFEIALEDGRLVLTPARVASSDGVRRKLEALGLSDVDIQDAVDWARKRS
jgi:hypothetical protein